jgi:ribose 5-phosphate isomerase B
MGRPVLAIACDHGGYELKCHLKSVFTDYDFLDLGCDDSGSVDYPDYAQKLVDAMKAGKADKGILVCGTGVGMAIAANRHTGIRAVNCTDIFTAEFSRRHNDSNVIALGGRVLGKCLAEAIVQAWLRTEFEAGRHINRVNKLG